MLRERDIERHRERDIERETHRERKTQRDRDSRRGSVLVATTSRDVKFLSEKTNSMTDIFSVENEIIGFILGIKMGFDNIYIKKRVLLFA